MRFCVPLGPLVFSHLDILCTRNNCRDRLCCSARIYSAEDTHTSHGHNKGGDCSRSCANNDDDDTANNDDAAKRTQQERKKRFPVKGQ